MAFVRSVAVALLVLGLAGGALAQGLEGALERQDQQRQILQSEMRRENESQRQELQRQLDQGRLQQQIERQLILRQTPVTCPFSRPSRGC